MTVADHDEEAEMVATRAFGDTGITVSEIGLGTWQLGRSAQWPDGPDEGDAIRIVHAALDAGVTFIDTAPGYADGQSELNIGAALRGRSDEVVICTKFGHTPEGTTNWAVEAIGPSVRRSAERLGVDHIDIVVLHNPPAEILDGTRSDHYEALEELKQAGLIRAYGASVDWSDDVDLVLATTQSRALEVRMSALYQEPWDAVARAYDEGVGTIIKVPLESGWLAGRYSTDSVFTGVRARWSRDDIALRSGLVDELRALLPHGVPLLDGALRFLLAHHGVSTVIPGTRSVAQLQDAVVAAAEPLPDYAVTAIRDLHRRWLDGHPLDW